jgi:hypothetical protein
LPRLQARDGRHVTAILVSPGSVQQQIFNRADFQLVKKLGTSAADPLKRVNRL